MQTDMWDLLQKFSHGRISVRRISLLVTAVMMTFFVTSAALTRPAYADDVIRTGSDVAYQGRTYKPLEKSQIPSGLPSATQGFGYFDEAGSKAYFIFTTEDLATASTGQYVVYDFNPPNKYSNPTAPVSVNITGSLAADAGDQAGESRNNCDASIGAVGWIVCPVVTFLAKSMDFIYGVLTNFLVVKTVTGDTNSSIYQLWVILRDVANICFVIVFLVIVYSQLTGLGINNYGIKHMLPRLIIAAILVNVSYWICAIGVDASNLLGYSIHSVFMGVMERVNVISNYSGVAIPTWEQITVAILSGGAIAVGGYAILSVGITGAIALLVPFVVGAMISALVALIVLAARQALITCLVIISPLAFVAYVLPNTEKYFDKWRGALMTLLVMFPIFSAIFSGAQLAGMAIVQNARGNILTVLLGMAVQVAPIVITPLLIKLSGNIIGRVAGIVNNPSKGLVDRSRNWANGVAQERKNKILADQNRLNKYNGKWWNPARATRAIDTRRRKIEGRRKAYEAMAENRFNATRQGHNVEALHKQAANQKVRNENVFAASTRGQQLELESRNLGVEKKEIDNVLADSTGGRALETRTRNADIRKSEITNTYDRTQDGQQVRRRQEMAEIDKQRVHNEFEATSMGHEVDRAKRVVQSEKKRVENDHQARWDRDVRTDPGLLDLELSVKASEVKASVEKAKLEKMHAEVVAQGSSSDHILNLRGVDVQTQAGMLNIAHDIKNESLEATVAATAKSMAERVTAEAKTAALKENTIVVDGKTIVEYAAGVKGAAGERSLLAKAKSENSAALLEDIKNIQSTMDYDLATNVPELRKAFESTDLLSEKIAYAKAMSRNGGPGVGALRKLLSDLGDFSNPSGKLVGKEDMLTFKEILAAESGITGAGKDIEFFLTNSKDPSDNPRTFADLASDIGTWTNMSATAFASQNATTHFYAFDHLHNTDPAAYMRVINAIRSNETALGSIKQKVREKFSIYSDEERAADPTLPPAGTIV